MTWTNTEPATLPPPSSSWTAATPQEESAPTATSTSSEPGPIAAPVVTPTGTPPTPEAVPDQYPGWERNELTGAGLYRLDATGNRISGNLEVLGHSAISPSGVLEVMQSAGNATIGDVYELVDLHGISHRLLAELYFESGNDYYRYLGLIYAPASVPLAPPTGLRPYSENPFAATPTAAPPSAASVASNAPTASAPAEIVLGGTSSPVGPSVGPDQPVAVEHTEALTNAQNYRVTVGARAAPVTITLPDPGGTGQWIEIIDASMQAADHPISVDPGSRQIEGGAGIYELSTPGAVLEIYYTGFYWKIL